MTKYIVHKTKILDPKTKQKVGHGEIVDLDDKAAEKFNNLGFLRPYITPQDPATREGAEIKRKEPRTTVTPEDRPAGPTQPDEVKPEAPKPPTDPKNLKPPETKISPK